MEEQIWHEFEGDDNCEDCRGWDGEDRRCDCGNRRVGWSCLLSKCVREDENCSVCEHAYAEAY